VTASPRTLYHPADEVVRHGPMRVLRFRPKVEGQRAPRPVLLVPSIINRPYILDLREGQSLAGHLLEQGLDVFLVDWGAPRAADAHLDLEGYAVRLLRKAIRGVRAVSGADRVDLFGYCLGGTFALIAGAAGVAGIGTICTLTTPVDLSDPGALGVLTDARLVDVEKLASAYPIVPGPALWATFQALDPVGIPRKFRRLRWRDSERRARFKAQEAWLNDPVPMTARVLRDIVEGLYRQNRLATGALEVGGRPLDLARGKQPVLNLIAQSDSLVPPQCSRPLADLWGGPVTTREFKAGHIGVTVGSRAPQDLWTAASDWLRAHQPKELHS